MAIKCKKNITIEDLERKIEESGDEYDSGIYYVMWNTPHTEPHKVKYDCENITGIGDEFNMPGFTPGYATLRDGTPVRRVGACGDWEMPLAVCVYIDDNDELKIYVPKAGNVWNYDTGYAYGNDVDDVMEDEMEKLGVEAKFDMKAMEDEMLS